jgi:hypothetical protein
MASLFGSPSLAYAYGVIYCIAHHIDSVAACSKQTWTIASLWPLPRKKLLILARQVRGLSNCFPLLSACSLAKIRLHLAQALPSARIVRTRPKLDYCRSGTPPVDFASDLEVLRGLLKRFCTRSSEFAFHAMFGKMSKTERMRYAYLHFYRDVEQFVEFSLPPKRYYVST